ncbi:hypothetical protein DFAR_1910005 [Desulfarculales bacterium]
MVGPDVFVGNGVKIQSNVSVYKGVTLEGNVSCGPSIGLHQRLQPSFGHQPPGGAPAHPGQEMGHPGGQLHHRLRQYHWPPRFHGGRGGGQPGGAEGLDVRLRHQSALRGRQRQVPGLRPPPRPGSWSAAATTPWKMARCAWCEGRGRPERYYYDEIRAGINSARLRFLRRYHNGSRQPGAGHGPTRCRPPRFATYRPAGGTQPGYGLMGRIR